MTESKGDGARSSKDQKAINLQSEAFYQALARRDKERDAEAQKASELSERVRAEQQAADEQAEEAEAREVAKPPEVLYDERLHWVGLLDALRFVDVIITVLVTFAACAGVQAFLRANLTPGLRSLGFLLDLVFPLLPAVFCVGFIGYWTWHNWRSTLHDIVMWDSTRWVIDAKRVHYIVKSRNLFVKFIGKIEDQHEYLERSTINDPKIKEGLVAGILGYAILTFETPSQGDETFKNIRFMRKPRVIKDIFGLE